MLEQRNAADDDFIIVVGSTLIILAIWLVASMLF